MVRNSDPKQLKEERADVADTSGSQSVPEGRTLGKKLKLQEREAETMEAHLQALAGFLSYLIWGMLLPTVG